MERPFYCYLDTSEPEEKSITQVEFRSLSSIQSSIDDDNIFNILQVISNTFYKFNSVHFICEDGGTMIFPLFITLLFWPTLCNIIKDIIEVSGTCEDNIYHVFVPCDSDVLACIRDLIFTGECSYFKHDLEMKVYNFIHDVYLELNIHTHPRHAELDYLPQGASVEACEQSKDVKFVSLIESGVTYQYLDENGENSSNINVKDYLDAGGTTSYSSSVLNISSEEKIQHVNKTEKIVSSKSTLIFRKCAKYCRNDCELIYENWSVRDAEQLKDMFKCCTIAETKSKLIMHLQAQENISKSNVDGYVIKDQLFCTKFLEHVTGVSNYILKKVLNDYRNGVQRYHHGNSGIVKSPTSATVGFCCWFKTFLILHGQDAPDKEVVVLNFWHKGRSLYQSYVEEAPEPHIKLSTFYQHIKKYFGPKRQDKRLSCVRISDYSSHAVCDICSSLNYAQKMCKNETELNMIKGHRNLHKVDYSMARRTVETMRQHALEFPEDVLFLQIDGMDNQKGLCIIRFFIFT